MIISSTVNPFVTISWPWRAVLILFVLVYNVFVPGLRAILVPDGSPLAAERVLLGITYQLVLFAPLFFYRPHFGWLHPLLFIPLYGLAQSIVMSPGWLLAPLTVWAESAHAPLAHAALIGWSQEAIAGAMIKAGLISLLALVAYLFGFLLCPQIRVPQLNFPPSEDLKALSIKTLAIVAFSGVLFLWFMHSQGGISAHMSSFGGGRFRALAGTGHIRVLIGAGALAVLAWYTLSRTATRSPLFWVASALTVPSVFFISGSRSGVIKILILFIVIWIARHHKVPSARIIGFGILILLFMGSLGALRRSAMQGGEIDWSVLTKVRASESIESAQVEFSERSANSGTLAIAAKVPTEVGHLYGKSYVGTVLFFVPRAIWPEKPRGVGSMVTAYLFRGWSMDQDAGQFEGGGIPAGAAAEVYWNFALPGVVLVYAIFGMFHRWLAATFVRYSAAPAMALIYVVTLHEFEPRSTNVVPFLQQLVLLSAILWWMGGLRPKLKDKSRPSSARLQYQATR